MSSTRRSPSEFYVGPEEVFSPLWEQVGPLFISYVTAKVGDRTFDDDLYCETREHGTAYVTEDAILAVASDGGARRLLVVTGQTGVGKSTLLHRVFRSSASRWTSRPLVWIDVLSQLGQGDPNEVEIEVLTQIASSLSASISHRSEGRRDLGWIRHVLTCAPDPTGELAALRRELEDNGSFPPGSLERSLASVLKASSNLHSYVRLQAGYLQGTKTDRVLVIIDNCDQLPSDSISRLVRLSRFLSEGSQHLSVISSSLTESEQGTPLDDSLQVIIALRDASFRDLDKQARTHLVATVGPPSLSHLLEKRLNAFQRQGAFSYGWITQSHGDGCQPIRILPRARSAAALYLSRQGTSRGPEEYSDGELLDALKDFTSKVARALLRTRPDDSRPVANTIHLLTNFNTRLSLLLAVMFVSSGHIDPFTVLDTMDGDLTSPRNIQSRMWMALLLGKQALHRHDRGWLINLFSDGTRERAGLLVRFRVLWAMHSEASAPAQVSVSVLIDVMHRLFAYESERVTRALRLFLERGLAIDVTDSYTSRFEEHRVQLSDAGAFYLKHLARDYVYMDVVSKDVFVSTANLVPAKDLHEPFYTRYTRAVSLCREVLAVEEQDFRTLGRNGLFPRYTETYGEASVSRLIIKVVLEQYERRLDSRARLELEPVRRELDAMLARSHFESLSALHD